MGFHLGFGGQRQEEEKVYHLLDQVAIRRRVVSLAISLKPAFNLAMLSVELAVSWEPMNIT